MNMQKLAFLILLIGAAACGQKIENPEILAEQVLDNNNMVAPQKALSIIASQDDLYQFIDLRSEVAFKKGHIANALHIPYNELLDKAPELADNGKIKIVYADELCKGQDALFLLYGMGFKNVKALATDYYFFEKQVQQKFAPYRFNYLNETPVMDFRRIKGGKAAPAPDKKQEKIAAPSGGC